MNTSTSQSSGDCESGWTVALEQWQGEAHKNYTYTGSRRGKTEEEGEENLSMLSDASSGPPFYEVEEDSNNENECSSFGPRSRKLASEGGKNKKKVKEHGREEQQHLFYEDTTTSVSTSFTKKKYFQRDSDAARAKGKSEVEKYHIEKSSTEKKGDSKGRKLW